METEFTPWASLGGGVLIGLAAVLLMALHGRILGATGILGGLLRWGDLGDWALRAALVVGMATGPLLLLALTGEVPAVDIPVSTLAIIVSGVVVGVGVSYGGGCTSGHGVCGISRFAPRGIGATVIYLAAGAVTMLVFRHVLGVI